MTIPRVFTASHSHKDDKTYIFYYSADKFPGLFNSRHDKICTFRKRIARDSFLEEGMVVLALKLVRILIFVPLAIFVK